MSYKEEINFIQKHIESIDTIDGLMEQVMSPVEDTEIKNYDYFVELVQELRENLKIVENINKQELMEKFKSLTESQSFEDPAYDYCEKKVYAFTEINRIEEVIQNLENFYLNKNDGITMAKFKYHAKEHPLNLDKVKEIKDIVLKIKEPLKFLEELEKLSSDSQIEKVYAYSRNESLIEGFLNKKEDKLEIEPEAHLYKNKNKPK